VKHRLASIAVVLVLAAVVGCSGGGHTASPSTTGPAAPAATTIAGTDDEPAPDGPAREIAKPLDLITNQTHPFIDLLPAIPNPVVVKGPISPRKDYSSQYLPVWTFVLQRQAVKSQFVTRLFADGSFRTVVAPKGYELVVWQFCLNCIADGRGADTYAAFRDSENAATPFGGTPIPFTFTHQIKVNGKPPTFDHEDEGGNIDEAILAVPTGSKVVVEVSIFDAADKDNPTRYPEVKATAAYDLRTGKPVSP